MAPAIVLGAFLLGGLVVAIGRFADANGIAYLSFGAIMLGGFGSAGAAIRAAAANPGPVIAAEVSFERLKRVGYTHAGPNHVEDKGVLDTFAAQLEKGK
jgi:hypothetical protein